MSWVFQPLTGDLIFVPEASSGGDGPFVYLFNATTDWGSPSGGYYNIVVTEAVHGKGLQPSADLYELNGITYEEVYGAIVVAANGNVTISVPQSPDLRFEGRILIY